MKVLITGSSTGFGRLIAETLLKNGHQVAASMRNIEGKNKDNAAALKEAGAKVVDIDVTDCASVKTGVAKAIEELGGLDAVVNNAGAAAAGIMDAFKIDDWQKIFDLNVFGVARVNKHALPHLREQGSGLIIHVSSIVGRMTLPFMGPYVPSKWALEGLAETIRLENANFGVESVIVEPGGFATEIFSKLAQPSDEERVKLLGDYAKAPQQFFEGFGEQLASRPDQQPQDVADAIVGLIEMEPGKRPFRTVVDKLGMKEALTPINEAHEKTEAGIYEAFGLSEMAQLKTKTPA